MTMSVIDHSKAVELGLWYTDISGKPNESVPQGSAYAGRCLNGSSCWYRVLSSGMGGGVTGRFARCNLLVTVLRRDGYRGGRIETFDLNDRKVLNKVIAGFDTPGPGGQVSFEINDTPVEWLRFTADDATKLFVRVVCVPIAGDVAWENASTLPDADD